MASIFTQIINGEIPCHKIYEDEYSIAFLDIHPLREGHTLVVAKREVTKFHELEEDEFANLMRTVHKVGKKIDDVLKPKRVVEMAHSYGIEHVHIHLVPTNSYAEFRQAVVDHEDMDMSAEPDHAALAKMAARLVLPDSNK